MNEKPKTRWRFGLRWVLFVPLAVGSYLACWEPTVSRAPPEVSFAMTGDNDSPTMRLIPVAPLILERPQQRYETETGLIVTDSSYYFWFFGFVKKLPVTSLKKEPLFRTCE